ERYDLLPPALLGRAAQCGEAATRNHHTALLSGNRYRPCQRGNPAAEQQAVSHAVVFMGSKAAGLLLCETLCDLLPGRLSAILCPDDTADARSALDSFRSLAERHAIPLQVVASRADT